MLANGNPSEYGYAPSPAHGFHQHSGERPTLYALEQQQQVHDYQQHMHGTPHHAMTPQHHQVAMTPQHHQAVMTPQHHAGGEYDHEPLMMNVHAASSHYYPALGTQMLHVSSDYDYRTNSVETPSSCRSAGGTKRSREDLNMKEKKRMFKLNDRINQLKDLLDEAGVQTKKNKQSILDNAAHYIEMLRTNLLIAKQKAERAERQAESFRAQAQKSCSSTSQDSVFKGCFQQSSTPRVVVDLHMRPVAYNSAFVARTGQSEDVLKQSDSLSKFLCVDAAKLDRIVKSVSEGKRKPTSTIVQATTASGDVASVTLMASVVTDDQGNVSNLEFSLIPMDEDDAEEDADAMTETSSAPPAAPKVEDAAEKSDMSEI